MFLATLFGLVGWFQTGIEPFGLLIFRLRGLRLAPLRERFCKVVMHLCIIGKEFDRSFKSLNRSVEVSFFQSNSASVCGKNRGLHIRLFPVEPRRLLKLRSGGLHIALLTK